MSKGQCMHVRAGEGQGTHVRAQEGVHVRAMQGQGGRACEGQRGCVKAQEGVHVRAVQVQGRHVHEGQGECALCWGSRDPRAKGLHRGDHIHRDMIQYIGYIGPDTSLRHNPSFSLPCPSALVALSDSAQGDPSQCGDEA